MSNSPPYRGARRTEGQLFVTRHPHSVQESPNSAGIGGAIAKQRGGRKSHRRASYGRIILPLRSGCFWGTVPHVAPLQYTAVLQALSGDISMNSPHMSGTPGGPPGEAARDVRERAT